MTTPPRHVYFHVPFCARRCTYCDFAIAVRAETPIAEYLQAIEREIVLRFGDVVSWPVDTLYFGGGTPSRLGGDGIVRLIEKLRTRMSLATDAEVTVEANPDDVSVEAVRAWREVGVNRLSIGAQSFDPQVLDWMRRTHTPEAIPRSVDAARQGGIDAISLDLIFALPEALKRSWSRDLEMAFALRPDHLSMYGLTVHERTPLSAQVGRGETHEASEDSYAAEFLTAHDLAAAAGYEHYEVSNFARAGRRARHNSAYWSGVAYAGIGPAAHEYDGTRRRWNVAAYVEWRRRLVSGIDPVEDVETLTPANRIAERTYVELRTKEGTVLQEGERRDRGIARWVDMGWAIVDESRLRLTPSGWLLLDELAATLTEMRSRY